MLTNLMEGRQRKCEQYWPESGSEEYGPFMVNLIEEQVFADYTIRTMHLVVRILTYQNQTTLLIEDKKKLHVMFSVSIHKAGDSGGGIFDSPTF